jgi:hypothetical protein
MRLYISNTMLKVIAFARHLSLLNCGWVEEMEGTKICFNSVFYLRVIAQVNFSQTLRDSSL